MITQLSEMAYHDHIVVEVGGGLVMKMLRGSAEEEDEEEKDDETEEALWYVDAMVPLLQKALPHCEVSFLAVLPRNFSAEESLESIGARRITNMDPFAEDILHAALYNITLFHASSS